MNYDICIYHRNCPDGFTAAWLAYKYEGVRDFLACDYGDNVETSRVYGKHVLIVDFSFPQQTLLEMSLFAHSITVLDHHKSAAEQLAEFKWHDWESNNELDDMENPHIRAHFDMNRSGAMLAWHHFGARMKKSPPSLVRYVQDRDLWQHKLPATQEVNAYISAIDYDFQAWEDLNDMIRLQFQHVQSMGHAIMRYKGKDLAEQLEAVKRPMVIGGHSIMVANLPYSMASDAGNILAKAAVRQGNVPFGGTYFDTKDGSRKFSLRSIGEFDVSAIATKYGMLFGTQGGGHKNAAGFSAPAGWAGDEE